MHRLAWLVILSCLLCTPLQAQESFRKLDPWEHQVKDPVVLDLISNLHIETTAAHEHPDGLRDAGAAEADRLIAMFFVLECDEESARRFFGYARIHDPKNELIGVAEEEMEHRLLIQSVMLTYFAGEKEKELEAIQKEHGKGLLWLLALNDIKQQYAEALRCYKNNPSARSAYSRIWLKQHGDWKFTDRLGYH